MSNAVVSGIENEKDYRAASTYITQRKNAVEYKIAKLSSAEELGKPENRHLFYERRAIKKASLGLKEVKDKFIKAVENNVPDNKMTTSTYDTWYKRNAKKFADYYYGR